MRHFIKYIVLILFLAGCFSPPDYNPDLNPFLKEFSGSFLTVTKTERQFDGNGNLRYKVFVEPNYDLVPFDVNQLRVKIDERPDDNFFIYLGDSSSRFNEVYFIDSKVKDGETHEYDFYLSYKNNLSQPSTPSFELKVEP